MVVICPKCKAKLKVDDSKLSSAGSRFKCPKCSTILVVKKPAEHVKKVLDSTKVLLAHSDTAVLENARTLLQDQGYKVITSADGIDAMHRPQVAGVPLHQGRRQQALSQQLLRSINVGHQALQQPHALQHTGFDLLPAVGLNN